MDKFKKFIYEIKDYIIILLVVILVRSFIITPARVNGASMDKTLEDGQIVLLNKIDLIINNPKRFQIVVIKNDTDHDRIIKRIIALPNETIKYSNNKLYINDKVVEEKYEHGYTDDFEYTTKENEYFVLGDNREVSKDSRYFGAFNKKDIIGSVKIRLYPFDEIGSIK
jgi:signal peptidase I